MNGNRSYGCRRQEAQGFTPTTPLAPLALPYLYQAARVEQLNSADPTLRQRGSGRLKKQK